MVLTGKEISRRLEGDCKPWQRLYVLPLGRLRVEKFAASIDVHLGCHFILPRRAFSGYLDPLPPRYAMSDGAKAPSQKGPYTENAGCGSRHDALTGVSRGAIDPESWEAVLEKISVRPSGELFLHPGQFVLAAVYEYVRMPLDLCADVLGRSSWARVGLVIAMATFVHPGYCGCLTLELQNLGQMPIRLKPGLRVAQLVFREVTPPDETDPQREWPSGQIRCSYEPEYWPVVTSGDRETLRALASGELGCDLDSNS